ncbi:hypothetical protein [Algibacillus agarilyticus]|uniref:hypothetical protein n=1 Tax=Algibacillus agarilyticus TaxID=2234133 RepID=UPI000DCF7657|nr:hypothetical protein [Algibacillus agarilyticus]
MLDNFDRFSFLLGGVSGLCFLLLLYVFLIPDSVNIQSTEPLYNAINIESTPENTIANERLLDENTNNELTSSTSEDENQIGQQTIDWQQALNPNLSIEASFALSELSSYQAAKEINQNTELYNNIITAIQLMPQSEQRAFLRRTIQALNPALRLQASHSLLASNRVIDKKEAISLIMSLDNKSEQQTLTQHILQTETQPELLKYMLAHINADNDQEIIIQNVDTLKGFAELSHDVQVKGLAIKAMMQAAPNDEQVFEYVIDLVNSAESASSGQGLNILHQQLNDYQVELSAEQIERLQTQLSWIADDTNQLIDNRIQALLNLKVLKTRY